MNLWEDAYKRYKESDIDFELDQYDSPIEGVGGTEFGEAFRKDLNKIFEEEISDENISDLMWGASTFPHQPFSDKLKSFRAWIGNFIRLVEETNGTIDQAVGLYNKEFIEEGREITKGDD